METLKMLLLLKMVMLSERERATCQSSRTSPMRGSNNSWQEALEHEFVATIVTHVLKPAGALLHTTWAWSLEFCSDLATTLGFEFQLDDEDSWTSGLLEETSDASAEAEADKRHLAK